VLPAGPWHGMPVTMFAVPWHAATCRQRQRRPGRPEGLVRQQPGQRCHQAHPVCALLCRYLAGSADQVMCCLVFRLLHRIARDVADVQMGTPAGETAEEVQHVSRQLRASGIGSILAYSVESDVDAATATACQIEAAEVHTTALWAALPSCMCSNWCHLLKGKLVVPN
jgi:hypothetical protein